MNDLSPERLQAIEAQAREMRAREVRRLAVAFVALVRRAFGRDTQTRTA
ncbi:RSP_7527 family protein [Gemmobacter nectariphilus]|nr:hypothetical protein [Gemmobacter nectariphilus]